MKHNIEKSFLDKKYPDLKKSKQVEGCAEVAKASNEKVLNKTDYWIKSVEDFHKRHRDNPEAMDHIRNAVYDEYVIKPENIPESYFENQQQLVRELGHGDVEITEENRKQLVEIIIDDQKTTLDNWTDYITHKDADVYPMWAKYWAFRSMLKLSSYDKEKKSFGNRRKDTVTPFPDLNREALACVIDIVVKKVNKEKIEIAEDSPELQKLIKSENFGKLYAYAIEKVTPAEENELLTTEGEWIKYPQNSDHMPLVDSLQGHGTGWCTAGESTAEMQLKGGDFYVYYSLDKNNKPTIPRVAIRMEENRIGEIRGIAKEQNIDPYIQDIVDEKLSEFPDKDKYKKKTADMKFLTQIDKKQKEEKELNIDELKFLYEIETNIEGFGYQKDPRIKEIKEKRDIKEDFSLIAGLPKEQISITKEEALSGEIKFHYGNLDLSGLQSAEGLKLPETVNSSLYLSGLQSAEGLNLPETVNGGLYLSG
ncbi:MAG: hypothetical protein KAS78_03485, partial [Candidatus Pacebacteria bacterium]|nr:hypothetical protein [Candidatus Paceibacterota bacterium]